MDKRFDIIEYLSGMTNFVFDAAQLKRVAYDCGVINVMYYCDLTDEQKDKCLIELLKLVVYGPITTASISNKHGNYETSVGAQTISDDTLEAAKARLRTLLKKYDLDDEVEELDDTSGVLDWIHEYD